MELSIAVLAGILEVFRGSMEWISNLKCLSFLSTMFFISSVARLIHMKKLDYWGYPYIKIGNGVLILSLFSKPLVLGNLSLTGGDCR